jgi:ketosteroid isomerase-like protein
LDVHHATLTEIAELHRRRGEDWVKRDADAYLSFYWEDAVIWSAGERLTMAEVRRAFTALLAAGGGPLSIDLPPARDVVVNASGDAVVASFEWSARVRGVDGVVSDRTLYESDVWFRRNGAWKIIHMHLTVLSKVLVDGP